MADGSARIISPAALQKFGKDFGRNPVGTGPYKFVEWIPNQRVVAEANPDYWGPKPQVRRWVYRPIPEAAGRVVALKTGEADIVLNLPAADVDALQAGPEHHRDRRAGPDDHRGRAAPVQAAVQRRQGPLRPEPRARQGRDHRQRPARGGVAVEHAVDPGPVRHLRLRPAAVRPGEGEAADDRGRLPERLRRDDPLRQRALVRRRPGGRGDAGVLEQRRDQDARSSRSRAPSWCRSSRPTRTRWPAPSSCC